MLRAIFLITMMAGLASISRAQSEAAPPTLTQTPTQLPKLALRDLRGRTVRLSDYKGKVVLLNFWATWCPPCRAEMPDLVKLQNQYSMRGLQIIGFAYPPENRGQVRRLARILRINYPLMLGTRAAASSFGVGETLPVTLVIGRDGRVRARIEGILEPEEFAERVAPLLR